MIAAFASLGMKQIAGHTLGMDPDQDRIFVLDNITIFIKVANAAFCQNKMRLGGGTKPGQKDKSNLPVRDD